MRKLSCVAGMVVGAAAVAAAMPLQAAVIRVDAARGSDLSDGSSWAKAKRTVTAALSYALPHDEVWVAAGTYQGTATLKAGASIYGGFAGNETSRSQRDITRNKAVLQGPGLISDILTVAAGAGPSTVIDGLVFANSKMCINCNQASPAITHNTFTALTSSYGYGIAVESRDAAPVIQGNVFTGISGNNIRLVQCIGGSPVIRNNTFVENISSISVYASNCTPEITGNRLAGYGQAICLSACPNALIKGNTLASCRTYSAGSTQGCAIYVSGGAATIARNRLTGTIAEVAGVGVYNAAAQVYDNVIAFTNSSAVLFSGSTGSIENNTIVSNSTGISILNCAPSLANNIVALSATGISVSGGPPTLSNNCVFGSTTAAYSGTEPGTNDILDDPQFAGSEHGDYRIRPVSPCRDAGNTGIVPQDTTDMAGQPRLQGAAVDIGAYESGGSEPVATTPVIHVSPTGDDTQDGSCWDLAKRSVGAAIAEVSVAGGGEVWVASGGYAEDVCVPPFVYLYGGFEGNEVNRDSRDPARCISSLVHVSFLVGHNVSGIDGFRVTGSLPTQYSGSNAIEVQNSSPVISGNTFDLASSYGVDCLSGASPLIRNNVLSGAANTIYAQNCAAVHVLQDCSPAICGNRFVGNNRAVFIDTLATATPTVSGNTFRSNYMGIIIRGASATVNGNTLTGCTYGVELFGDTTRLVNNTISANDCGVVCVGSSATVTNNILASNATGLNVTDAAGTTPHTTIRRNCLFDSPSIGYTPTAGDGTITDAPKLVSTLFGELHLQPDSPCIDTGDTTAVGNGWKDIDGQDRVQGPAVDMGADEFDGTAQPFTSKTVRVKPDGDDTKDGATWDRAKRTIQAAANAAGEIGGYVWVAAGDYVENITLPAHVFLLGGFAGTEESADARMPLVNQTRISAANPAKAVVSIQGHLVSRVSGFTISGGSCGVGLSSASSLIDHNVISGNRWGIYQSSGSGTRVEANSITKNKASASNYYGGGICAENTSISIRNNIIAANDAALSGYDSDYLSVRHTEVVNNTIVDHVRTGRRCVEMLPNMVFANNILAFNASGLARASVVQGNCAYSNVSSYGYMPDQTGQNGNISADPLFVDRAAGDYHLRPQSPCVDAGLNSAAAGLTLDFDGDPRIQNGKVDIGADELSPVWPRLGTDGQNITLRGAVVTAAFDGFFYVQSDGRAWGIRVDRAAHGLTVGARADVIGALATNADGERLIQATLTQPVGNAGADSLALALKDLRTSPTGGVETAGLLVSAAGRVTSVDTASGSYVIDDGSLAAGASGVMVQGAGALPEGLQPGAYVRVTGACSTHKSGEQILPLIRQRAPEDLQIVTAP